MKRFLFIAFIMMSGFAHANEVILAERTTLLRINLNETSVKCSIQGYSMPNLKVLVPELAAITILNHRNSNEGAPCIAAGSCSEFSPSQILSQGNGIDEVPVHVVLRKSTELHGKICRVTLIENVDAIIRGIPFYHERIHDVADRIPADCK